MQKNAFCWDQTAVAFKNSFDESRQFSMIQMEEVRIMAGSGPGDTISSEQFRYVNRRG